MLASIFLIGESIHGKGLRGQEGAPAGTAFDVCAFGCGYRRDEFGIVEGVLCGFSGCFEAGFYYLGINLFALEALEIYCKRLLFV